MKPILVAALAASALAFAAPAYAQTYPNRTITIVVPYPAGGPTDETARVVAHSLSEKLKQNVIVENVTGGGTIIATNKVVKATPDGNTLLLHNLQISANVTLYKNLPFDTEKDLIPVMLINENPLFLVGNTTLAPNNLTELLALMKKQTLKAAIPGYGATGHLTTTLLAQVAKVSINQIPYRGAAPALTDLLGGHVDLLLCDAAADRTAGEGRKGESLWDHGQGKIFRDAGRREHGGGPRAEVRHRLLAGPVRAGRHAAIGDRYAQ